MQINIDQHIQWLTRIGAAEVAHRNGTLLAHLKGVWDLLYGWGNSETVCLAGLYHSVYSTGGFEQQLVPLDKRHEVANMIGKEAEHFAYLFGACDRPLTHSRIGNEVPLYFHDRFTDTDYPLEDKQWRAVCEIMLANELDLGRHDPVFYKKHLTHYRDLFVRFEPWLSGSAIRARREFQTPR